MSKQCSDFDARCYELLAKIPEGKVTTYQEMARALNTRAWRAVGSAMARNQNLITVPCHRVVRSNGEVGQYALGANRKAELLQHEGVSISNNKVVNLNDYIHRF